MVHSIFWLFCLALCAPWVSGYRQPGDSLFSAVFGEDFLVDGGDELSEWDIENWPGRLATSALNESFADEDDMHARRLQEGSLPKLTSAGKRIKTVVFASMLDGTCKSDDWRGDLPRHFMRYLPDAEGYLVYARHPDSHDCASCGSHGTRGRADCQKYLSGDHKKADLLVVIGTGLSASCSSHDKKQGRSKCQGDSHRHYTSLDHVFHSRYASKDTLAVHIPVRKISALNSNKVFNFQHVIHDNEFLKPLAQKSIDEMRNFCKHTPKEKTLMYVGRYTEGKGQLSFLKTVVPAALAGYDIEFFGGDYHGNDLPGRLRQTARDRNISITVHSEVSHHQLLHSYCKSAGLVHYAKGDNNPRVAYEALYAGSPLFVTKNAKLPGRIYEQTKFVTSLEWGVSKEEFATKFQSFMDMVKSSKTQKDVYSWVDRALVPDGIYRKLCVAVGVCSAPSSRSHSSKPRKAGSSFKPLSSPSAVPETKGADALLLAERSAQSATQPATDAEEPALSADDLAVYEGLMQAASDRAAAEDVMNTYGASHPSQQGTVAAIPSNTRAVHGWGLGDMEHNMNIAQRELNLTATRHHLPGSGVPRPSGALVHEHQHPRSMQMAEPYESTP